MCCQMQATKVCPNNIYTVYAEITFSFLASVVIIILISWQRLSWSRHIWEDVSLVFFSLQLNFSWSCFLVFTGIGCLLFCCPVGWESESFLKQLASSMIPVEADKKLREKALHGKNGRLFSIQTLIAVPHFFFFFCSHSFSCWLSRKWLPSRFNTNSMKEASIQGMDSSSTCTTKSKRRESKAHSILTFFPSSFPFSSPSPLFLANQSWKRRSLTSQEEGMYVKILLVEEKEEKRAGQETSAALSLSLHLVLGLQFFLFLSFRVSTLLLHLSWREQTARKCDFSDLTTSSGCLPLSLVQTASDFRSFPLHQRGHHWSLFIPKEGNCLMQKTARSPASLRWLSHLSVSVKLKGQVKCFTFSRAWHTF